MFSGSITALVTPMKDTGCIDYDAMGTFLDFQIKSGTDAVVSVGTTGESATLSHKEHIEVLRFTIEYVNGRIPVIAGTGSNNTQEAIEFTQSAKQLHADACLLVAPYYIKPTQEGLYQHYSKIANAVDIPQILYNVPGRTACPIQTETVERLMHHSNIVGIKDATGDLKIGAQLMERCAEHITILSGDDATALSLMKMGAKGNISVVANVAPALVHQVCSAVLNNEITQAETIHEKLIDLNHGLFCESNPIPVKFALSKMGLISNTLRLPLTPLPKEKEASVLSALGAANIEC